MDDETQLIKKPVVDDNNINKSESGILSISIRGWLALIVIFTVCFMSATGVEVKEPLYTMCGMMIAFYYAQNKQPNKQP